MTLREYMTTEGLKKCPKCGKAMKDCKCAKDFDAKKKACHACEKEETIDESLGLALGAALLGSTAGAIAAGIVKQLRLKKWQDAKRKANVMRLASSEYLPKDSTINMLSIKDGELSTGHIPSKSLIEKYYKDDKEDFEGFLKEVKDSIEKAYKELKATFDIKENKSIGDAISGVDARFYCYHVDFTNEQKKEIKKAIKDAISDAGIDKRVNVKVMVEKKKELKEDELDEGRDYETALDTLKGPIRRVQKAYKNADQRIAIGINWAMEELFGSGWERI